MEAIIQIATACVGLTEVCLFAVSDFDSFFLGGIDVAAAYTVQKKM